MKTRFLAARRSVHVATFAAVSASLLALAACDGGGGSGDDPTGAGGGSAGGAGGAGQAGSGATGGSSGAPLLTDALPIIPKHMVAHGDSLFITGGSPDSTKVGGLYQLPKAGGAATAVWTQQNADALSLAGDSLLVVTGGIDGPSSVFRGQDIGRIAVTGGALTVIATIDFPKDQTKAFTSLITGLVVDGDKVFLQDTSSGECESVAGAVGVMNLDGSGATPLTAAGDEGCVSSLTVDGDTLYWIDYRASAGGSIRSMPKAGGSVTTLLTDPAISQYLAVTPDALYYLSTGAVGGLLRLPKAGGTPTVVSAQVVTNPLLAVGSDVYAIDYEMIRFAGGAGPGTRLGQYTPGYAFVMGVLITDGTALYGGGAVLNGATSTGAVARTTL